MKCRKDFINFAKSIVELNKVRTDNEMTLLEQEQSDFFIWIMEQIIRKIGSSYPKKKDVNVILSAGIIGEDRVRVQFGNLAEFYSNPEITAKEFFDVMCEVAEFFDSIPNYKATYIHEENSNVALFTVFLNVEEN